MRYEPCPPRRWKKKQKEEEKEEEEEEVAASMLGLERESCVPGGYPAPGPQRYQLGNGCMAEEAASGYCGSVAGGYRGRIFPAPVAAPRLDTQPTETSAVAQPPSARLVTTQQPTGNKQNN